MNRGRKNAFANANSLGLTDLIPVTWLGKTSNLDDYDNEFDREAYLRGRLQGDFAALLTASLEIGGGTKVAIAGSGTLVLGVTGTAVATHGLGVTIIAMWDIAKISIILGKVNITATDANSSQQSRAANGSNGGETHQTSPEPVYENPGHHDKTNPNFNKKKSILPSNAEALFKQSVKDPKDPKTRWAKEGKGNKAVYHRFQSEASDGSKPFHWNGSTNATLNNGTPNPINLNNVPIEIKRL